MHVVGQNQLNTCLNEFRFLQVIMITDRKMNQ